METFPATDFSLQCSFLWCRTAERDTLRHMPHSRRLGAEMLLLAITVIWGGTFIITKSGLEHISPTLLIGMRFLVAFVVVTVLGAHRLRTMTGSTLRRGAILGILLCASYLMQTTGLLFTTASRSGFITYLYAVLIPPFQFLILRRPASRWNLAGLAIVLIGILFLTQPAAGEINAGDLLTIGCAIGVALYIIYLDRFSRIEDPANLVIVQFGVTAAVALGLSAAIHPIIPQRLTLTIDLVVAIAYLAVLGTVVALGVQNRFQRETTPVRATIIFAFEPVFAALFGVLAGEPFGPSQATGAALVIAGLLVSELSGLRSVRRRLQRVPR